MNHEKSWECFQSWCHGYVFLFKSFWFETRCSAGLWDPLIWDHWSARDVGEPPWSGLQEVLGWARQLGSGNPTLSMVDQQYNSRVEHVPLLCLCVCVCLFVSVCVCVCMCVCVSVCGGDSLLLTKCNCLYKPWYSPVCFLSCFTRFVCFTQVVLTEFLSLTLWIRLRLQLALHLLQAQCHGMKDLHLEISPWLSRRCFQADPTRKSY